MANDTEGCNSNSQEESKVQDVTDGPQPMMNRKPCKTTPNSADQFWQSHQAEYEARGKRSTDQVERAQNHNATYPVLKDELDKRRSVALVTTGVNARNARYTEFVCNRCKKLRQKIKDSECLENNLVGNMQHKTRDRVIKKRTNRCRKPVQINGRRQYVEQVHRYVKRANGIKSQQMFKEFGMPRYNRNLKKRNTGIYKRGVALNDNESGSESGFVKKPSSAYTDRSSVTSYHSFSSMDHEPMI